MMVNSATVSAENMALIIENLTKTIEQLNANVASLQVTVQELKNDNNLLLEENKYLKRKLFGTKSETAHSLGFDQLSFFDEVEKECEPELLEEISYTRAKKRFKDERKLKSQDAVKKFLGEFKGTIITDGYAGYNELSEEIANAYCWAHARRKFVEAIPSTAVEAEGSLAKEATDKIGELFKIEMEIDNLTAEEKFKIRQKKSKPLVDKFFSWCHSNEDRVLARSKTGKAIHYCIKLE